MDGHRILNQKALAHLLGIDRKTLYRWHDQKIGPPRILVKKRYYYVMMSVQEWLKTLNDHSLRSLVSVDAIPVPGLPSPIGQSPRLESVL